MGARAVQKSVLEAFPEAKLEVYIVWANILVSDHEAAVAKAAEIFSDPRVVQFHDSNRRVSQEVARQVKMPAILDIQASMGQTREELEKSFCKEYVAGPGAAFDMFLFFAPGARYETELPKSVEWFSQMDPESWTGLEPGHFFRGKVLEDQLKRTMQRMTESSKTEPQGGEASKQP